MFLKLITGLVVLGSCCVIMPVVEPSNSLLSEKSYQPEPRAIGIYGASMNLQDAQGNLTTVSVDSIKKSYRKVGPFSLKVAPFIEAKNVVIQTSGSVNEPKTLLLNSFGNVVGKDFVTHVAISELVIISGGQTNRYDKVRL